MQYLLHSGTKKITVLLLIDLGKQTRPYEHRDFYYIVFGRKDPLIDTRNNRPH